MEYFLLQLLWFYIMLHSGVMIYKAQRELNKEIKKGNIDLYLKKHMDKPKSFS